MKEWLRDHLGNPRGQLGKLFLKLMHRGHSVTLRWSIEKLEIRSTDTILDIGCGSGNAIQIMAPRAMKVYGIDRSPLAVEEAVRQNQSEIQKERAVISLGTLDEIEFPHEAFQFITAFDTVYFWEKIEEDFQCIFDLLSFQGKFAIFCSSVSKQGNDERGSSGFRLWSIQELAGYLKSVGFSQVRIESRRQDKDFLVIGEK